MFDMKDAALVCLLGDTANIKSRWKFFQFGILLCAVSDDVWKFPNGNAKCMRRNMLILPVSMGKDQFC